MSVAWPEVDPSHIGVLAEVEGAQVCELLDGLKHVRRGDSFLAWQQHRYVYELYRQLVQPSEGTDRRSFDDYALR